jgi:hypothetical protein
MDESPRKRSQIVMLTLIGLPFGAMALANAFPPQETKRNLYPDRAACERDYSPQQCQSPSGSGSSGGSGSYWHGPYYSAGRSGTVASTDPGPGRTGQAVRAEVSTRGGFGAFGRAMRSVG